MSKQRKQSEMFPLIKSYFRSEVSQVEFCHENHLKVHTFQYWLSKYKQNQVSKQDQSNTQDQSNRFIPVQINEENQTQASTIKINYPSGVSIEIPIR